MNSHAATYSSMTGYLLGISVLYLVYRLNCYRVYGISVWQNTKNTLNSDCL